MKIFTLSTVRPEFLLNTEGRSDSPAIVIRGKFLQWGGQWKWYPDIGIFQVSGAETKSVYVTLPKLFVYLVKKTEEPPLRLRPRKS